MRTTWRWQRAAVVWVVAGVLGACGGDGAEGELSAAEEAQLEREREFAGCMREQGFDGFPDPKVSGDGFMLVGAPMAGPGESEEWDAAQEACHATLEPDVDAAGWQQVAPGGDCQCSDGSELSFWLREADPEKVVVFLQGGGACFSAETCAPDSDLYQTAITEGPDQEGIFDVDDERNPFADHSVVFVPYCTGDVHIGNATTTYSPDLTVQHKGYVNGTAALDHVAATFPDATEVVVMGESAGSVAVPLYAGLVSDRLPDARITALADGSGSYPDQPDINARLAEAWGTADATPPWPESAGLTAEQRSLPGLFVQSGRHDPEIVFARHDYAYDERQASRYPSLGIEAGDLLARIDANEARIEAAGVDLHSYTAPGDDHTVLGDERFYTEEVDGQLLVDWVARLVAGEPVEDVRCDECAPG